MKRKKRVHYKNRDFRRSKFKKALRPVFCRASQLFDFPRRVDGIVTKTRGRLTIPKMPPETSRHCRDGLVFLQAFLLFPGSVRRRRLRSVVPADEDQSQSKSYR